MADWISLSLALTLTSTVCRFRFVAAGGSVIRVRFTLARETTVLSTQLVLGGVAGLHSIPISLAVVNWLPIAKASGDNTVNKRMALVVPALANVLSRNMIGPSAPSSTAGRLAALFAIRLPFIK